LSLFDNLLGLSDLSSFSGFLEFAVPVQEEVQVPTLGLIPFSTLLDYTLDEGQKGQLNSLFSGLENLYRPSPHPEVPAMTGRLLPRWILLEIPLSGFGQNDFCICLGHGGLDFPNLDETG
jgi:hypothetical protein